MVPSFLRILVFLGSVSSDLLVDGKNTFPCSENLDSVLLIDCDKSYHSMNILVFENSKVVTASLKSFSLY